MYDSTDPFSIPANAQMVAGYIDGTSYKWTAAGWARFPNAVKVRIARRTSTNDGHVLDVEYGIPTVWPLTDPGIRAGIINWVKMRRAAGVEPTIYCNQLNDWQPIRNIFIAAGVTQPQWWVARYNNVKDIPAGAVAKQYANPPLVGFHADASVVADYWPGVDETDGGIEDMATINEIATVLGGYYTARQEAYGDADTHSLGRAVFDNEERLKDVVVRLANVGEQLAVVQDILNGFVGEGVKVVAEGQITIKGQAS